jgi:RHH-type rel operon transcriptional repressor/antitoxin RelB
MLAIRLPQDLEKRLTSLAKTTGRTKSFYARKAIEERIDDMEDIYLAEKSLAEVRAGAPTISHEDMMKRYGLKTANE